jgi:hypothetical protein
MFELDDAQDQRADLRLARLEARVAELEALLARTLGAQGLKPSAEQFAKTQRLPTLGRQAEKADPGAGSSDLGITAAFATLDSRIAEAADFESSLAKKPDLFHVVPIDPDLIQEAYVPRERLRPPRPIGRERVRSDLEELHPGLLKRLMAIWRSVECHQYLRKLIVDDRGDRNGFDPRVMSELLFLNEILDVAESDNAWAANARTI